MIVVIDDSPLGCELTLLRCRRREEGSALPLFNEYSVIFAVCMCLSGGAKLRFISNTIFVILLAAMLALGWGFWKHHQDEQDEFAQARQAVELIQHEVNRRMAGEEGPLNEFGYPPTIDPEWFDAMVPANPLLDHDRPWMELANTSDLQRGDPRDPVVMKSTQPELWYNPRRGIVRARVSQMVSDRKTLEVYNYINHAELDNLFSGTASSNIENNDDGQDP